MKKISFLLIILSSCYGLGFSQKKRIFFNQYDILHPSAFYLLPDTLYEISGLTDIDSNRIGCVQDEKGLIFLYDLQKAKIISDSKFYLDGDYEGITRVGNDMYVLRSDGMLFRVRDYMLGKSEMTDSVATEIPINNNEGLAYDPINHQLLIACKGKLKSNPEEKDARFVYAFSLDSMKTGKEPILKINVNSIADELQKKGIDYPATTNKKTGAKSIKVKFFPSSIAVHTNSNTYFILSAVDRLLIVMNRSGQILDVILLDEKLFPKPEGITFLSNGDLLISNEGNGGKPNLLRFNSK